MIIKQNKELLGQMPIDANHNHFENSQTGRLKKLTRFLFEFGKSLSSQRFETTYQDSSLLPFDNKKPLIFFSDCHRGDNGLLDKFAINRALFLHALSHYDERGYTYVEVGDGDDLWQVDDFKRIESAHRPVFDRLKKLHTDGRLHMILGNHDVGRDRSLINCKSGIPLKMGVRLQHTPSGRELFVTHGHQADMQPIDLSRILLRHIAMPFQQFVLQAAETTNPIIRWVNEQTRRIEQNYEAHAFELEKRIKGWAMQRPNLFMVCGHTHKPRFGWGNYFNTGSCLEPGLLTGIEIVEGKIMQIRWAQKPNGQFVKQTIHQKQLA